MRGVGSQSSQGVSVHLGQQSLGDTTAGRACFQISDTLMSRSDAPLVSFREILRS